MTKPTTASQAELTGVEDHRLPDEDLTLFRNLQPAQTRQVALARVAEYEAEIVELRRYIRDLYYLHNAALPIHTKLSKELLAQIFCRIRPTCRWCIRITHVCRIWRVAALSAAAFWAGLTSACPNDRYSAEGGTRHKEFLPTLLERSAPLNVDLYIKGPHISPIHPRLEVHSSRLSSIFVTFDERHLDALRALLLLDLPSLGSMTLIFSHRLDKDGISERLRTDLPLLPHLSDRCPRLHTLHISGALVLPALLASSLRTLQINACPGYHYVSEDGPACISGRMLDVDKFLDALQRCPSLEVLEVQKNTSPAALAAAPGRSLLQLPKLRRCTIDDDNPHFIRTFLANVGLPSTVALRIAHKSSPLSHLLPAAPIPLVTSRSVLDVTIERRERYTLFARHKAPCSVTINQAEGRLPLGASYPHWSDDSTAQPPRSAVLREIVQVFAPSRTLREVTLRFQPGFAVVQADWDDVLEAFPGLRKLTIHIDTCRRLVATLRRPHICPHLETIAIHSSDGKGVHENVVLMAEYRVATGTPLRRFEYHQKPRKDPRDIPLARTQHPSTPLSKKRLARLQAFIPEVDTTPHVDDHP